MLLAGVAVSGPSPAGEAERTQMTVQEAFAGRFRQWQLTRALAFGSSNTERRLSGMHWFDGFELAIVQTYGRMLRCINTGIGGDTTRNLLARYDEDAARYAPHLVFVTIGGNDSNPEKKLPPKKFADNLRALHARFRHDGCQVVFQTYYSADPARIAAPHMAAFHACMQTVRDVAAECEAGLIDHLARWEPYRLAQPEAYAALMRDGFHVNRHGNMVMALDIARHFGAKVGSDEPDYWRTALDVQACMDALSPATVPTPVIPAPTPTPA